MGREMDGLEILAGAGVEVTAYASGLLEEALIFVGDVQMGKVNGRQVYLDVATHANVPVNERKAVVNGRGGERKIPRRYHLQADEIVALRNQMQEAGKFISPYGTGRIYTYIIESLVALGAGKAHDFNLVYDKFKELASSEKTRNSLGKTLWDRFADKEVRNIETGRDAMGKFMQNLEVLQRLGGDHPYAFKLAQVGACIDILTDQNQQVMVQLRTGIADGDIVKPVNTNRRRNYTKTVDSVSAGMIIPGQAAEPEEAEEQP